FAAIEGPYGLRISDPIEGPYGLRISDPIEGAQFTLLTPGPVTPTDVDPSEFALPVDAATEIAARDLETPYRLDVLVRDADATTVAESVGGERAAVGPGEYYVEMTSAKMKLYLRVAGGVTVEPGEGRVRLSFPSADTITVGARSFHERPAATVETTDAPADVAAALSQLGSALKTTSCERSFPTLRGHPPLIERGTELSIPDGIEPPDTGVTIEVPPRMDALFPVAPLAYYLGAAVTIGDDPLLVADGEPIPLEEDGDLESTVARVLRQVFLLECVTRTEGLYDVPLHERQVVESAVDLAFDRLYDLPPDERIREFLAVPESALEGAVPTWKLTADVVPAVEHVSVLPFLANELAVVRCPADPVAREAEESLAPEVRSFFGTDARGALTRGVRASSADSPELGETLVHLDGADSIERTYVGDGIPLGASKMGVAEYRRRLDFEGGREGRTRVLVVCNDPEMRDENAVSDIYGTREWIEFDITTRAQLRTDELADLLATDADFLHYVGHVDDAGIRCVDGHLDARTLTDVNVSAFLLNACTSYQQGRALVDAGARGGIVTLTDVLNPTATEIGRTVARFLNEGFSLLSMLDLVEKRNSLAHWYVVVGDGNATLVESKSGTPNAARVNRRDDGDLDVTIAGYPSKNYSLGTLFRPYIDDSPTGYLNAGEIDTFTVTEAELAEFFGLQEIPVVVDDDLYWSDELAISEL
ncbi:MAG: hypothetical protein ABEJ89_08605, partial [Haloarculaceae archaeon]